MNPERWSQIQDLFHSALEREPAGRAAFVAQACGEDTLLRMEVEALLAADEEASSGFLQGEHEPEKVVLEAGSSLGTYRVLGLVGRGGMGEVYRARDDRLAREVAIKVLPLQTAAAREKVSDRDAQLLWRFEREALLTANVQHPAVVPIYERGELPDGRPFYAMKLLSGRSLRQLIDEGKTLPDRMALLPDVIAVAEALAHAHWQRIVHRDVKPSNIVVGEFGETVLIDWGLAKNLAEEGNGSAPAAAKLASDRTAFGEIIGTPAYMSPEQANGLSCNERSDVFSLGATLYHVLTGRAPYEGVTPLILPKVKQGDYAPLSVEMPEVSNELAAIVSKAMAREPSQRYPTARELAEDLRRFQTGQLVLSHRYSARELLGRWAKRYRTLLLATAAFIVVAVVSGAIAIRRIVAERDRANGEAEASQRVSQFMTDMFKVSDPSESRGNNVTAREILEKASKQIESGLSHDPTVQAHLMHNMAQVYSSLGLFAKARPLAEKAVEIRQKLLGPEHVNTLSSMNVLGNIERRQGRLPAAAKIHQEVLEIRRRVLGPQHPDTLWSMNNLAVVEANQGRNAEAERLYRQVVDVWRRDPGIENRDTLFAMNNLGVALLRQGKFAESEKLYREVLDIQRGILGSDHPETLRSMNNVAVTAAGQGHFVTAEKVQRQVVETRRRVFGAEHPETLRSMNNLADDERALGQYAEAEELYRTVIEAQLRVLGADHPDRPRPMSGLGSLYLALKRFAESEKIQREAVEVSRRILGPEHSQTLSCMTELAEAESAQGRHAEAEELGQKALDIQRRVLSPEHPDTLLTMIALANIWSRQGRLAESERLQLEALAIGRRTLGPNHPHIGLSLYGLGRLALRQGDRQKALDYLRQAVDHGLTPDNVMQMQQDDELRPLREGQPNPR